MVKDNPVFGLGFDRFKSDYMDYQANYFVQNGETKEAEVADNTYYAFNEYLQFIAEEGVLGLLLLIILVFFLMQISVSPEHRFMFLIILGCLISKGLFAFFSYPMQILPIKLILVVLLGLLVTLDNNTYEWKINTRSKRYAFSGFKVFVIGVFVFGGIKGFGLTKNLEQSFKIWKKALMVYNYGDYIGAIDEYEKIYPVLNKEGDFLMNYGKALVMGKKHQEAIEVLEQAKQYLNTTIIETALGDAYMKNKQYSKAEAAYQHAANMIPVRFYPLYLLAKLYEENGEKDKGLVMAKAILLKDVKVPSTAIKEIRAEMKTIISNYKDLEEDSNNGTEY
ncbi:hypothetical protein GCM10022395_06510 [Snuella lapsa]|uniref:Tetratricopeptide repeat protein n=2 Tax=Snuella lapsa TaxID=870481 RepID=A0ABP6WWV6_9FLAO